MTGIGVADQAAKILGPLSGTATIWGLELGLRLGVFEHLATRPTGAIADEVAWSLGLDPLSTRVLLRSAYAAEVLDREDGRYRLAPHMDTVLLDQDSPAYLGGAVGVAVALRETFLDLRRFARTGERKWWNAFDPEWIDAVGSHCQAYYRRILDVVLPRLPHLAASFERGARHLDLACGTCRGPAKVVSRYPATHVTAVDTDAHSLEVAQREMKELGISEHFTFVQSYLEDLAIDGGHDVALINVSLHEARDIQNVVARARAALEPGGVFLVSEFPFPEREEDCLLEDAGFRDVGVIDVNPTHVVVHGRK